MLSSPLLWGLILMIDPQAKTVDWSGGAAMEVRGGLAPPTPVDPSEPTLRASLAPRVAMSYMARRKNRRLLLENVPRVFFRLSENSPRRPLLFDQLTGRYSASLSPRWTWSTSVGASVGEQDYTSQSEGLVQGDGSEVPTGDSQVSTNQPTLVNNSVIVTGGLAAQAGFTNRITPLHTLNFGPAVSLQRLIGGDATGASFNQTNGELAISYGGQVSAIDTVGASLSGGYSDFGSNGSQAYASASANWRHRLRPRLDTELIGGAFFVRQVSSPVEGAGTQALPVLPTGSAILVGRILERTQLRIVADVNLGSQAYFDPVRGSVLPLSGGGLGLTFIMPPDVTAGVAASFFTPPTASTEDEQRFAGDPTSARTVLSVRTPVTYTINPNLGLEFGTIATARGPNLDSGIPLDNQMFGNNPDTGEAYDINTVPFNEIQFDPWRFTQAEFWVYVAFQIDYTTARSP